MFVSCVCPMCWSDVTCWDCRPLRDRWSSHNIWEHLFSSQRASDFLLIILTSSGLVVAIFYHVQYNLIYVQQCKITCMSYVVKFCFIWSKQKNMIMLKCKNTCLGFWFTNNFVNHLPSCSILNKSASIFFSLDVRATFLWLKINWRDMTISVTGVLCNPLVPLWCHFRLSFVLHLHHSVAAVG